MSDTEMEAMDNNDITESKVFLSLREESRIPSMSLHICQSRPCTPPSGSSSGLPSDFPGFRPA